MPAFTPISPAGLASQVADLVDARHRGHPLRLALDGPAYLDTAELLDALDAELLARGRSLAVVPSTGFLRDASVRLEYGHTDVESFYSGWLDTGALRREVLEPVAAEGRYLPSLRDPASNRSTRSTPVEFAPQGVLLVRGELLLGHGLPFDVTVHLAVSRQARRRQIPAELAWTLPAFDRYDLELDPAGTADITVRWDDPRRPATRR